MISSVYQAVNLETCGWRPAPWYLRSHLFQSAFFTFTLFPFFPGYHHVIFPSQAWSKHSFLECDMIDVSATPICCWLLCSDVGNFL